MKLIIILLMLLSFKNATFACSELPELENTLAPIKSSMDILPSLDSAWKLKLSVRTMMLKDFNDGVLNRECSNQYKKYFSNLRIYEDRVADLGSRKGIKNTDTAFTSKNPQLYVAPGETMNDMRTDLQSGDIVISRGNAFTSSAISHLGDSEQQFSHMSLVYKSPSTGKLYTIEAHIELGVIAKPLTANIAEMNSRDAVFRFQDQKAAHLAAQYMYYKALAISKTGKNIDYDFSMNMKDTHSLFCSEVVSSGFSHSSKGKIEIPLFRSSLTERNLNFEHAINVYQNDSFLPGDIEIDPRFTMIAEWKDWTKIRDLHEKDAILRSMLSWMNDKNYQFDQSNNSSVWFKKNIGYAMRRIPLIDLLVKDKMPLNMSRDLIGLFTILDQVGESLQFILQQYNDLYIQKTGGTLPSQEWMMSVLEVVRVKDSKAETPIFHQRFHPL